MTCQYVLLDRFDDISRRLLPTSKKIGTSSWQQCPCQEKRAERSPGRARDIDGKQTQHIIIWQWAQERKFVLKLQTYHENMWKQWNPEQLYNYQPVLPFEVPRNALEEWDLVSFWYISTLAGCSLEHATSELKADPEFLAAKSWHKAKVATSLWSFWRLVLETSYLFINYLFYRNFQQSTT